MYQNLQHSFENHVILVVEDDYDIGDILEKYIKNENMQVIRAMDGQQALEYLKTHAIDLILLDIKLPKVNGWDILQIIRQSSSLPVIMLTALDDQINKIMGLKMGADDFIIKPFNPNEVIARVQAVLRRSITQTISQNIIRYQDIEINLENHQVFLLKNKYKQLLNLTLTEYNILVLMLKTPNKVFTRHELIQNCMPESDALDRTVDSHMSKLRKKLEENGIHGLLTNVRGVGYRLDQKNEI
ncbi:MULTISPECIES: efflux system response regulator transcription factor AdeR [unclassified Acinetobacter]|uniref:efflux system response regulator transcription factor AdeR n=1 Tax=unclassified Acinetobacter TaxID=196816 RepID=UPI002934B263|nr:MULTISPECIES: efflux system response regulator transcription factor AdeR [unclassified Acinetobacter]WOE30351.1 efflux system response regulator transcription factor AdeR [Acinetobacter sp. SAAs470]WOE38542.1 efflux system response regulator transcription factor AdeR [Acinetobacter sp. SAAs474]